MRLRKKADREQSSLPVADAYDRPAPIFVGFQEGQPTSIGALYEFHTAAGDYVYLHEMECVDMQYRLLSRQFALTFECVSSDLMPGSVVVLTFDAAEIYTWHTDFESTDWMAEDSRTRGQVRGLDCMVAGPPARDLTGVSFHLIVFDVCIDFFASKVTCDLRPGRWEPAQASTR